MSACVLAAARAAALSASSAFIRSFWVAAAPFWAASAAAFAVLAASFAAAPSFMAVFTACCTSATNWAYTLGSTSSTVPDSPMVS